MYYDTTSIRNDSPFLKILEEDKLSKEYLLENRIVVCYDIFRKY